MVLLGKSLLPASLERAGPSRPSVAGPAVPTAAEMIDVDAVLSHGEEGCGEAMANVLDAITDRKAAGVAGQAAHNLSYKSPPQRPDLFAELMSGMRARQERDDGLVAGVRCSMAYDQLPAAEQ